MGIMQQSAKRLFTLCVWTKGPAQIAERVDVR